MLEQHTHACTCKTTTGGGYTYLKPYLQSMGNRHQKSASIKNQNFIFQPSWCDEDSGRS